MNGRLYSLGSEDLLTELKRLKTTEELSDNDLIELHCFLLDKRDILSPEALRKYCIVKAFIETRSPQEQLYIKNPRKSVPADLYTYDFSLLKFFDPSELRFKEYAEVIKIYGIDIAWKLINIDFAPGGRVDLTPGGDIDQKRTEAINLLPPLYYNEATRRKMLCAFPILEPWVIECRQKFPHGLDSFKLKHKLNPLSLLCKDPVGAFLVPEEILENILENISFNPLALLRSLSFGADETAVYAAEKNAYNAEKAAHAQKVKEIKETIEVAYANLKQNHTDRATRDAFSSAVTRLSELDRYEDIGVLKSYKHIMILNVQGAIGNYLQAFIKLYLKTGKEEIKQTLIRYVAHIPEKFRPILLPYFIKNFPQLKSIFEEPAKDAPPQSAQVVSRSSGPSHLRSLSVLSSNPQQKKLAEQAIKKSIENFLIEARVKGFGKEDCVDTLLKLLDKMMRVKMNGFTKWPDSFEQPMKNYFANYYDSCVSVPSSENIFSFLEKVAEELAPNMRELESAASSTTVKFSS